NLIPQIQKGMEQEITQPGSFSVPDFFMFDIQEEQLDTLVELVETRGYDLTFLSPMVRARLEAVNNVEIDDVEESPDEQWMQRRMNILTYQDRLKDSESLMSGELITSSWDFDSDELPGISVEDGFARRMGFSLGDILTFDVQS